MNKMGAVANLLGVALEEEFEVEAFGYIGKFTDKLFLVKTDNGSWERNSDMLVGLLNGYHRVKKIPWRPNLDDEYYYIFFDVDDFEIRSCLWKETSEDLTRYYDGNCFNSSGEALNKSQRYMDFIKRKRFNDTWRR